MSLAAGLCYYFPFCQVLLWCIYLLCLAILYQSIRLLADELLAVSVSGRKEKQTTELLAPRKPTLQYFSVTGLVWCISKG